MNQPKKSKSLIAMKFGGTSVGSAERMQAVAEIIADQAHHNQLVVVTSAMAGVTDKLLRAASAASDGAGEGWREIGRELTQQHRQVAEQLLPAAEQSTVLLQLDEQLQHFENLCSGFSLVREVTPRALDALSSIGEVLAATLLAALLRARGVAAETVDAIALIVTDDNFGDATPFFDETRTRTRQCLLPLLDRGTLPVVTGFRAATRDGLATTLGRGGSDYSATLVGTALDAEEIWIWTDVDGVMTADPRSVPAAHVLPEISYREALEFSFFGAKVLHPKAIQPVMKKKIPLWIKNTFNRSCPGTKICESAVREKPGVRAITSVCQASLFTVSGKEVVRFAQLAAKVFHSLDLEEVATLMVTQSSADNVLSFAIHEEDALRVRRRLEKTFELELLHGYLEPIEILSSVGIAVVIGENMKGTPGIAGRLFSALGRRGVNVIAIAQGSSELSISFAVKSSDVTEALQILHAEFQP